MGKVTNWTVLVGDSYNLPTKLIFCASTLSKCEFKFNLAQDFP